jgi:hypothetical protein
MWILQKLLRKYFYKAFAKLYAKQFWIHTSILITNSKYILFFFPKNNSTEGIALYEIINS